MKQKNWFCCLSHRVLKQSKLLCKIGQYATNVNLMDILMYVVHAYLAEEPECAFAFGHTYLLHIPSQVPIFPEKRD